MNDLTAEAERVALEDLLKSDGWQVFKAHMDLAWGAEEFERRVDSELDKERADPMQELAVTKRIRDTFKGVRASLKWPDERLRALKDGTATKPKGIFGEFRRIATR